MIALSLIAFQLLDLASTLYILDKGGYERSPLPILMQRWFGKRRGTVVAKALAIGLILVLWRAQAPGAVFFALAVFYLIVLANNLNVIRKL